MESTFYVLSFRMVFFYVVTKDWIFDISLLCENSIDQSNRACGNSVALSTIVYVCLGVYPVVDMIYGASEVCTRCMRRFGSVW